MKRKLLSICMAMLILLSVLTSCSPAAKTGTKEPAPTKAAGEPAAPSEPITLTFFDKNTGDAFNNPVALKIIEETGISIEIQQPTGNPEEKLSLMLTSGDLPDVVLMDRRSDIVKKYIAAGALIPLNDLIDQYGADITEMYGDVLNKSRYIDGKNYFLNNWYGVDPDPDRGINMRMDLLEELGYGEKAARGEYFTQDEFVEILRDYKEKYSSAEQPVIPFTVNGELMETVMSTFRGMYGMKTYYEDGNKIYLQVRDPLYLEMVKFINRLYLEGLLDKEWAVNKEDIYKQKLSSGLVLASNGGIPSDINNIFAEDNGEDTNKQFYMFKVIAPGVDPNKATFSPRSSLGWDAIGITAKNEHPVETIKLFNYLASEEGQYLLMWGEEGLHWDMVDGKHQPKPEVIPGFRNDWGEYSKSTGIRKWTWFIKNGYGSDGTPLDLVAKYDVDKITQHARTSMANSVWDTAPYDNLGPLGGTQEALMEQKLKDIMDAGFSKMVYAKSEAEVEEEYNNMLEELTANNAGVVEEIYTANYQAQMELWKE